MKSAINTNKVPEAIGPFSQAIEINGTVYISGITAFDPVTNNISGGVQEQTERILTSMKYVLDAAGISMDHVVKATVFLKDVNDFEKVNAIYAKHFSKPFPARICVEVARIPKDALIEIDAVAYK